MAFDRSLRTVFNDVAQDYDEARPGYPEPLIEAVLEFSQIPAGGRILEIGCGPGKATLPFARRGYAMLCLELGAALAELARQNCRPYPRVEIQTTTFEAWPVQAESFDLVISAQAFHWIAPEAGYPRVARALKPSGTMALFWNQYPHPNTEFYRALDELYQLHTPHLARSTQKLSWEEKMARRQAELNESGFFEPAVVKRFPWSATYQADQYLKLLNTHSNHRNLEETTRQKLFEAIKTLIEQFGGTVEKPYVAVLYLARKKVQ